VTVNRRFVPTDRAIALHAVVREALTRLNQAVSGAEAFTPWQAKGVVNIGIGAHFEMLLAPLLVPRVATSAPEVTLRFHSVHGEFDHHDLDHERYDICIGLFENVPSRFRMVELFSDRRVAVMSKDHPLAVRKKLRLRDLTHGHWFAFSKMYGQRTQFDRALRDLHRKMHFHAYLSDFGIAPYLLMGGQSATTMPAFAAQLHQQHFGLVQVALPARLHTLQFRMVWPRRQDAAPVVHWVRTQISRVVESAIARGELSAPGHAAYLQYPELFRRGLFGSV